MKYLVVFLLIGVTSAARSQGLEECQAKIDHLIRKYRIPAMSLAYFDGEPKGKPILSWLPRNGMESSIDEQTVFSAASLSKPVTAYIVLLTVQEGKLDLDKPVAGFFQYEDLAESDYYQEVTARMLLTHSSGLPNWREGELSFIHLPGTKFSYSGEGFLLLQRILEFIWDKPFHSLALEQVFEPLGMSRSSFVWQEEFESNYTIPHDSRMFPADLWKPESANAAGSLHTTSKDYALFLAELLNPKLLSLELRDKMLTSQIEVKDFGAEKGSVSWGLGIGLQQTPSGKEIWHWGNNGNVRSYFAVSPSTQKGVVYFTNSQNGLAMTDQITDMFLGSSQPGYRWNGFKGQGKLYRFISFFRKKNIAWEE